MGKNKMELVMLCFHKNMGGKMVLCECVNTILSAFRLLALILSVSCNSSGTSTNVISSVLKWTVSSVPRSLWLMCQNTIVYQFYCCSVEETLQHTTDITSKLKDSPKLIFSHYNNISYKLLKPTQFITHVRGVKKASWIMSHAT